LKLIKKLNFDICTFCNHKCTFCSNPDERTIKNQVTLNQYVQVMDNVMKYLDVKEIGLSAKGEVLINKDLSKIIKTTKDRYKIPYIYISTNGVKATKKEFVSLLESGLDSTKFSINATNKEDYLKIHLSDDFDKVIENLKILIELKKTSFTKHKIFISSVTNINQDILKREFKNILGEDVYQYIDDIFVYEITYTSKFDTIKNDKKIISKCKIPFNEVYINSDCTLGLCCKDYFDEIGFGSLLENDFLTLYNSDSYEQIRQMHIENDFPDNHLCKNCLLYSSK